MDNENKDTGVIFPDKNGGQTPASVMLSQSAVKHTPSLASLPDPSYLTPPDTPPTQPNQPNFFARLVRRADVILALLLILGSIGLVLKVSLFSSDESANTAANRFETTQIPLADIIDETGIDFGTQSVTINGSLQLNSSFIIAPSSQPIDAVAGQIYYDQTSNVLAYYNGTQFVPLTATANASGAASVVQSVGAGLNLFGGQLSNSGVLSLQGQTGDVTLTAGPGIGISGTTISNTGVVSLVSGNPTLVITDDANGNYVLTVNLGGAGVTSLNGLAGVLSVANATGAGNTITIDDASTSAKGIAQFNGTNFTVGSGVVNTIQNINTGATPTFAGVNTNTITPSAALTVGSTGQQLTLQGNASTQLTATGGGFTTAVGFTGAPTGAVTFNFDRATPAGTYTICTTVGNCAGTGGGVSTSGGTTNRLSKFTGAQTIGDSSISDDGTNVTASTDLIIQGGDVTVGVVNTQTGTINLAHSGSSFLGSLVQGALTANRTYLLPDANGTVCLSSGNCSGSGSANTLQAAYDAGNTITTSDARNVAITLADTATDSNFLINLECDTACGANGRFAIQDDAVDVFTISPAGGAVNFINATDSTQAFNIEENGGGNLFTVDTINSRVGINLGANNTPTLASGREGVELRGALRVSGSTVGSHTDLYVTPNGVTESAKINVVNYDLPQFGQVIGLGLTAGSHADSRGIGVYDARTGNHQPAIAVFAPNENDALGFSWEGSNTDAYLKTLGADVNIRINTTDAANFTATAINLLQNTSVSGLLAVSTMGVTDTSTYLCLNTLNQLSACSASGAGSAFVQGGNSFGATAVLGTNDNFGLNLEVNNTVVATFAASNGAAIFTNSANSTRGFGVTNSVGDNIVTIDTANSRVGINLGGAVAPTLDGAGIEVQGGLRFSGGSTSGSFTDEYRTPLNAGIQTKINIMNYNPGGGNTTIATGLPSTADNSSTAIAVFDARANANHWPTIAVYSPDESRLFGLTWAGSSTEARLTTHNANGTTGSVAVQSGDSAGTSTTTGSVAIRTGNGTGTNVSTGGISIDVGASIGSGTAGAITLGTTNASALTIGRTGLSTNNAGTLTLGQLGTTNTATFLCRNSSNIIAACNTTGTGASFVQGGNSFGATAVLGTNDSNSLTFETNNATQATIAVGGATTFQNSVDSANAFRVLTNGSVELFGVDTTASIIRMFSQVVISGSGPDGSEGELSFGDGSWIPVISRIDDADVTFMNEDVLGFEAAGFQFTAGGAPLYTLDGFNGRHTFKTQSDFGYFQFLNTAGTHTMFGVSDISGQGEATFRNTTDSTIGFRVLKGNTTPLFQIDTAGDRVYIGNPTADGDGALLVLDTKDTPGDPTGVNGGMYYSDDTNTFRCYENGAWYDCLSRHKIVLGSDVADSAGAACTMTDITGLSFSVTSGTNYRFHANLTYTTAAVTTGSRFSVNGPATPTVLAFTSRSGTSATAETVSYANAYDGGTCTTDTPSTAAQGNTAIVEGTIRPSANGTFQLRVGTEVDTSAITVLAGSTLEWW